MQGCGRACVPMLPFRPSRLCHQPVHGAAGEAVHFEDSLTQRQGHGLHDLTLPGRALFVTWVGQGGELSPWRVLRISPLAIIAKV